MHNMQAAYQCHTNEVHHTINQDKYISEATVAATSLSVDTADSHTVASKLY